MKKIYLHLAAVLSLVIPISATAQTATFNYTGAVQTFTVPSCVFSINVDVLGGKGGNNGSYLGGNGGRVQATVPVTPGEVLQIFVGEAGVNTSVSNPPVYNGGGGVYSYVSGGTAGTGGGASDIRRAPYGNADRLVIAGGGGGGGYITVGGHGGGLLGQDGVPYPSWPNSGGKGGSQIAGGAAGIACCSCPTYTTAGAIAQGGNGSGDGAGGGGGGGGYFGGGGSCFAGGGGGSSYTAAAVTGVTHTQGYNNGAGQIVITYVSGGSPPASPASVSGNSTVCVGSIFTYSISPVNLATGYTWTVPPGATINSGQGTTSISVTFGNTSGTISVTADNICGSSTPTNFSVTVNPLPVVTLGNDITQCGGSVTLDAGNAGSSFMWSDNSTAQTLVVSASGTYSVVVTSPLACTASDVINVTINPVPTVALGNDITQCGGTVSLDAGNQGSSFMWNDNSTSQTLVAAATGTYSVVVTNSFGCTNSDAINITINAIPTVTYSEITTFTCINWNAIALTSGSPAGGTYSGPGVSGTNFDPATAGSGTHTIVYTYTDANGCTSSDSSDIVVDLCTGMNTNPNELISIFPNPNRGTFTISTDKDAQLEIVNELGQIVFSKKINAGTSSVATSNLAHGVYTIRLLETNGKLKQTKMVIEK